MAVDHGEGGCGLDAPAVQDTVVLSAADIVESHCAIVQPSLGREGEVCIR